MTDIETIFDHAIDLPPSEVDAYLETACAGDASLRAAVDALLAADRKLAGPRRVGAFVLGRKLGEGGMGVVHAARDEKLDRDVAVKLVRLGSIEEARALAKVAHPNVVPVYEVGQSGHDVFIVMELVDGETLAAWLGRPRSFREILGAFVGAGRGLEAVHAAGLIHGDFKPANVLVGRDGRPRVIDFGLAGTAPRADDAGTAGFLAPEKARGPAADQFAFAVSLERALAGVADVPRVVTDAVARATSTAPDARWPSMTALVAALAAPLAQPADMDPARSRNKRRIAGAILAVCAVLTSLPPSPTSTLPGLLGLAFVALGLLLILGIAFRRALITSAYNRRVGALFALPLIGFIVHRALALRLGSNVPDVLVADAISMAVVLGFAGLTVERWMGIVAVLAVVYAAAATVFPAWAAPGFGSLLCISAAIPVLFWRPAAPRK